MDFPITSCTGTVANSAPLDTASIGTKVFAVAAVDTAGQARRRGASLLRLVRGDSVRGARRGRWNAHDQPVRFGPTSFDPIETSVTSPNGGQVSINESIVANPPPVASPRCRCRCRCKAPTDFGQPTRAGVHGRGFADATRRHQGQPRRVQGRRRRPRLPRVHDGTIGRRPYVRGRDFAPSGGGDIQITILTTSASNG